MSLVIDIRTLQEIDDDVAAIEASLAEVDARLAHSDSLASAEAAFAEADSHFQDLRRTQRDLEASIASLTARIEPEERRLYDGSVRSPKELAAIQREVEHLKAQRSGLEDRLLPVMEAFEAALVARALATDTLASAREARESEVTELSTRRAALAARLASALASRQEQASRVPPASLRLYDEVRRRRGGQAVARVQGGTCTGCRVAIPESVRRKTFDPQALAQCPNCERILYPG
jgi:predicted  nucleic acid-binding Zn-ribbon protein